MLPKVNVIFFLLKVCNANVMYHHILFSNYVLKLYCQFMSCLVLKYILPVRGLKLVARFCHL